MDIFDALYEDEANVESKEVLAQSSPKQKEPKEIVEAPATPETPDFDFSDDEAEVEVEGEVAVAVSVSVVKAEEQRKPEIEIEPESDSEAKVKSKTGFSHSSSPIPPPPPPPNHSATSFKRISNHATTSTSMAAHHQPIGKVMKNSLRVLHSKYGINDRKRKAGVNMETVVSKLKNSKKRFSFEPDDSYFISPSLSSFVLQLMCSGVRFLSHANTKK